MAFVDYIVMFLVQLVYTGMPVINKLTLNSGENPFAILVYRNTVAVVVLAPFIYYFERDRVWTLTKPAIRYVFYSSLLGVTVNQACYLLGLKHSTPIVVSAISNLFPGMTFFLSFMRGKEQVNLTARSGKAKVFGTVACIAGAMVLSFYHGHLIFYNLDLYWSKLAKSSKASHSTKETVMGLFLILGSLIATSYSYIFQEDLKNTFQAPFTTNVLMSLMAIPVFGIIGTIYTWVGHEGVQGWGMGPKIWLVAAFYSGVLISGFASSMTTWCIARSGPTFVAMFSPIVLILVTIMGWILLRDEIYVGTVVGATLILGGLYIFLWGKQREADEGQTSPALVVLPDEPREAQEVQTSTALVVLPDEPVQALEILEDLEIVEDPEVLEDLVV